MTETLMLGGVQRTRKSSAGWAADCSEKAEPDVVLMYEPLTVPNTVCSISGEGGKNGMRTVPAPRISWSLWKR